jgi:hypothetical protein
MNQRHLLLTHLLDRTGCTHRSAPSQTSDFWSLQTMKEPDALFMVDAEYSVVATAAIYLVGGHALLESSHRVHCRK